MLVGDPVLTPVSSALDIDGGCAVFRSPNLFEAAELSTTRLFFRLFLGCGNVEAGVSAGPGDSESCAAMGVES